MTLVLEADLHILHERYMNRMKYENRHPVHMSARQDRFEDFKDYVERARKEGTVGTVIKICADDFSYRTDEELLQKIDCFMKEPGHLPGRSSLRGRGRCQQCVKMNPNTKL